MRQPSRRRVSLSMNPEQVIALRDIFAILQRGGDVKARLGSRTVVAVIRIINATANRAENVKATMPIRAPFERSHCPNGHEYAVVGSVPNKFGHHRCRACRRAGVRRHVAKRRARVEALRAQEERKAS